MLGKVLCPSTHAKLHITNNTISILRVCNKREVVSEEGQAYSGISVKIFLDLPFGLHLWLRITQSHSCSSHYSLSTEFRVLESKKEVGT